MKADSEPSNFDQPPLDSRAPRHKTSILGGAPAKRSILQRKASQKKFQLKELNNGKVILISALFAAVFSPFNGIQNFLHEIMKEYGYNNLGLLALGIFYISFGVGGLFTTQFSTSCDYKYTFLLSILPMSLFFGSLWFSITCDKLNDSLCSPSTIYLIVFGCSVVAGFGTSLLWITKSIYVTDSSTPLNKGKMFGIFYAIAQWTQLTGIVMTAIIFYVYGADTLFFVTMFLCGAASVLSFGVSKPDRTGGDYEMMYELPGVGGQSSLALDGEENLLQKSDVTIPRMDHFTRTFLWKCLTTQKMASFYPLFVASACNISLFVTYLATDVLEVLKEQADGETRFSHLATKVMLIFLALGLGEILADKFFAAKINTNKEAALSLVYKVFLVTAILHLILTNVNWYSLYVPLAFLYGVGDSGSQAVIGGLITMKFFERFEPFTCFRIAYFTFLGGFLILNILFANSAPAISFTIFIISIVFAWLNNYKFFTTVGM